MYCKSCGAEIPEGAGFCTSCGCPASSPQGEGHEARTSGSTTVPPATQAPSQPSAQPRKGLKPATIVAIALSVIACAAVVIALVVVFGGASSSQSSADASASTASSSEASESSGSGGEGDKSASSSSSPAESPLSASEAAARAFEDAKANNPSSVAVPNPQDPSSPVELAGVVFTESRENSAGKPETFTYLMLEEPITLTGTKYGEATSSAVILPNALAEYDGSRVTVLVNLYIESMASSAAAKVSPINATTSAKVVRNFEAEAAGADQNASSSQASQVDRDTLACDVARALFTTAEERGGELVYVGSEVSKYLAPGSPAEKYADGFNPGHTYRASETELRGSSGNTYQVWVFWTVPAGESGVRGHTADVSITFNDNNQVTDISFKTL